MNRLELKGIDGTNPLGFLSAMGAFRVASVEDSQTRMGWRIDAAAPYPMLHSALSAEGFAEAVCTEAQRVASEVACYNDIIKVPAQQYRSVASQHIPKTGLPATPTDADYFAAFASDGVVDENGAVEPTLLSFSNKSGKQFLLGDFNKLVKQCCRKMVTSSIIAGKPSYLPMTNLNWDPSAHRSHAVRWLDPKNDDKQTNVPLHVLAFLGLSAFTVVPLSNRIFTVGFDREGKFWTWNLWPNAISYSVAASLLRSPTKIPFPGVIRMKSQRFSSNKRFYFSPSTPL